MHATLDLGTENYEKSFGKSNCKFLTRDRTFERELKSKKGQEREKEGERERERERAWNKGSLS